MRSWRCLRKDRKLSYQPSFLAKAKLLRSVNSYIRTYKLQAIVLIAQIIMVQNRSREINPETIYNMHNKPLPIYGKEQILESDMQ